MNFSYYQKMFENLVSTGNPKKSGTLRGWQDKAIKTRESLKAARKDYDKELQEILATYSKSVAHEKKTVLDAQFDSIVKSATAELESDLDKIIESKQRQFDKCSGAPTEEELRLLQVLNMRKNLTIAEVANVIGKLNNNVQSLAVLRDIAERSNIHVPARASTPEEFDTLITRAREFSIRMLDDIAKPDDQLGYHGTSFYRYPDGPGEAAAFYGPLDNSTLTSEQISLATAKAREKETLNEVEATNPTPSATNPDEMWAQIEVSGQMNVATIANQFHVSVKDIEEANPGKDVTRLYTGDKILVPAIKFSFQPDPSGGHVQPHQVKAVPRPKYEYPKGPGGEEIGDDITAT